MKNKIKKAIDFETVLYCPGCGVSLSNRKLLPIIQRNYYWGNYIIPTHSENSLVSIACCSGCNLYFKNMIPSSKILLKLFSVCDEAPWDSTYNYDTEKAIIRKLFGRKKIDILDVGSGQGGFLKSMGGVAGRLSALDFVRYEKCEKEVRDEYILGMIDAAGLSWSGIPYDLITMFDIVEHLYDVQVAFRNLATLLKNGGYLIVETGNVESRHPTKFGVSNWWYINLLEHHLAFSPASLSRIATKMGFEQVAVYSSRHKDRLSMPPKDIVKEIIKLCAYNISPINYFSAVKKLGVSSVQPRPIFENDHFTIVFRRKCS